MLGHDAMGDSFVPGLLIGLLLGGLIGTLAMALAAAGSEQRSRRALKEVSSTDGTAGAQGSPRGSRLSSGG